ncbi:MAG: pilus assembly protein [Hyphomicrobiales bacterium]|nr:pilus assembly protein [Hyphomicrobiales bacterium]
MRKRLSLSSFRSFSQRGAALRDESGVAAVEFALILPIMLTLYMGMIELSQGFMASRKVVLLARTLSDSTSRFVTCSVTGGVSPCVSTTDLQSLFAAASWTLAPNKVTSSTLKMTVSQVDIWVDSTVTPNKLYAYTKWSASTDSQQMRPCAGGGATPSGTAPTTNTPLLALASPVATKAGNSGYLTQINNAWTPDGGSASQQIVADVTYVYTPPINFIPMQWNGSTSLNLGYTQYMQPRAGGAASITFYNNGTTPSSTNPDATGTQHTLAGTSPAWSVYDVVCQGAGLP